MGSSPDRGEEIRRFYESRGLGARTSFGERAALLVVDMSVGYTDPSYLIGADQTETIEQIARLLTAARDAGIPVLFSTTVYSPDDDLVLLEKIPALRALQVDTPAISITPALAPLPGEAVIEKKWPSSFFRTDLDERLRTAGVDTLVLVGCSTSGCIRAAAEDAVSYGYRVIVPREAVFDRAAGPHEANLLDIDSKFGDVVSLRDVLDYLAVQRS